jgi:hypothetical protein
MKVHSIELSGQEQELLSEFMGESVPKIVTMAELMCMLVKIDGLCLAHKISEQDIRKGWHKGRDLKWYVGFNTRINALSSCEIQAIRDGDEWHRFSSNSIVSDKYKEDGLGYCLESILGFVEWWNEIIKKEFIVIVDRNN